MTARGTYGIYLFAYNRLRDRLYTREHQIHIARKMLCDENMDAESREFNLANIHRMEEDLSHIRQRMNFLELEADKNGFDLTTYKQQNE